MQEKMIQIAIEAAKSSHSPYSGKKVGSSILWSDGSITSGTNIENASFGATVCAERVAIWTGIAARPKLKIKQVYVYINEPEPWPPCGMCRQVISEFADAYTEVICTNGQGAVVKKTFAEVFPGRFMPEHMGKN